MSERVLVLKFGRCSWGGCIFCGYGTLPGRRPDELDIRKETDLFFRDMPSDVTHVKVFGSGSFLDERQMPVESRRYFIEKCRDSGIKKLTIESRPEFITRECLKEFEGLLLEVAIGLEVADDDVLRKISKGMCLADFEGAAKLLHDCGALLRSYLVVNLPFVGDVKKSIDDSVDYALRFSDSIVVINLLPHHNSRLMAMWVLGEWNFLSRKEFRDVVAGFSGDPRVDIDEETFRFVPKFPENLKDDLSGVGEHYLTHPHFDVWHDYIVRWYLAPSEKKTVLFLPCAYKKPYSDSETHKHIIGKLKESGTYGLVHEVMLSNAGVIPREFEDYYPFNAYDWDERLETEEIKQRYITVTTERIVAYLKAHPYEKVLCYLKYSSESYQALEKACCELGRSFVNLLGYETYVQLKDTKKPLQSVEALSDLYSGLKNEVCKV